MMQESHVISTTSPKYNLYIEDLDRLRYLPTVTAYAGNCRSIMEILSEITKAESLYNLHFLCLK